MSPPSLDRQPESGALSFADRLHGNRTAWVILALSVALTFTAWFLSDQFVTERTRDRFLFKTQDIQQRISERLNDQYVILGAGVGLIESSEHVTREAWRTFVAELNLDSRFPGLLGYGYSQMIAPEDLDSHVAAVRADGFPDYHVKPVGQRDRYSAIVFLEPFDWRNQRAFGYDMYSEGTRREAMNRAIDTGEMAISGRVTLVQEVKEDVQYGFLMYLPVYRRGHPQVMTPQERQAWIAGFVYSPFRMGDLMQGILGAEDQGVEFALHDTEASGARQLMYTSARGLSEEALAASYRAAEFSVEHDIEIGGRRWHLNFYTRDSFEQRFEKSQPMVVALAGAVIDGLLFAVLLSLGGQKQRAQSEARKLARQALEESARLQAIFDTVEDGVVIIDQHGRIESVNPAVESVFGYAPADIIGRNVSCLMPMRHAEHPDQNLSKDLSSGESRILGKRRELEGRRSNGVEFPLELSVQEIRIEGQRLFLGVMRDLTEQKQIERLKSEFVSTVSHELRTPLTAIAGAISLLQAGLGGPLNEEGQGLVAIAHANSTRLRLLIDDILDMEKLASGRITMQLTDSPLPRLMQEACDATQEYVRKFQSELRLETVPEMVVRVDALRFQQILANLVSNAAKFSPPQSTITLSVERLPPPPDRPGPGNVRIWVKDQGAGIPEAFRAHLFERFAQADGTRTRRVGGSGLGLYISKQLVERMGGTIGYVCPTAGGTSFYIDLPPTDGDAAVTR